jgi:hypothetical protein
MSILKFSIGLRPFILKRQLVKLTAAGSSQRPQRGHNEHDGSGDECAAGILPSKGKALRAARVLNPLCSL